MSGYMRRGFIIAVGILFLNYTMAWCAEGKRKKQQAALERLQKKFEWWPTDAKPAPVKDAERGGYWWWPDEPGHARPWGNRGYVYVHKIIYDYQAPEEDDVVPPLQERATAPVVQLPEMKPSLLVKKIIKNVKIYFSYNKADLREDHIAILSAAVKTLRRNPQADILITGNCDARGSDEYNLNLGKKRGAVVKQFMRDMGIPDERIKILSRGKLDAAAPLNDLVGMQKDRNAQFVIAEVEEVMIPAGSFPEEKSATRVDSGKYIIQRDEKIESGVTVSTREYVVKKNDSLWRIAEKEMGAGNRWKYLYELNKERIKDPGNLKAGQVIIIPVE